MKEKSISNNYCVYMHINKTNGRKMSLNGARTILVTIDGETGSIRYWAKKLNLTHIPLIRQKRKYGYDAMVKYIKDRVQKISA